MNRIQTALQQQRTTGIPLIIPYITPEFPVQGATVPVMQSLAAAGAGMIEIGIPFSDPLADGPVIQHSSEIAIRNGATLRCVLDLVAEARRTLTLPILLMGYANPILKYGIPRFCADAAAAAADGLIIPDLPPEESAELRSECANHGLSTVFLMAPTSTDERIRFIDECSSDFSYCVSVTGVTGARTSFGTDFDTFLGRVKKNAKKPFVVGFGIKSAEQVKQIAPYACGAVVGSALLQAIAECATPTEAAATAGTFLTGLR